jgi:site-specific DNA recombinase
MNTNKPHYIGYVRVSTAKQGEKGVSLQEQRDAIAKYAERQGLVIRDWCEERVTAAKKGRPVFSAMMRRLRAGEARGVVVHKIDRSARNLSDWADLGELIDAGVDVRFANESLDLTTRGGRLTADIQAVIAADYVRNLKEETRKGMLGRLKQGIYPLPAPVGYLDQGSGKPKVIDPLVAPHLRQAFLSHAKGEATIEGIRARLYALGVRNRRGGRISVNGVSTFLRNPFYMGVIRVKRTGETFSGIHEPLVDATAFEAVQRRLDGRVRTRGWIHDFTFRRLLKCKHCSTTLIGETRKGHVYYRCHTRECPTTGVREDVVDRALRQELARLELNKGELEYLQERLQALDSNAEADRRRVLESLKNRANLATGKLDKLTDAYLEETIDRETYLRRREALLSEQRLVEESKQALDRGERQGSESVAMILGLVAAPLQLYESGLNEEKRQLAGIVTSDRWASGRNVELTLREPFLSIAKRRETTNGVPYRGRPRTLDALFARLVELCSQPEIAGSFELDKLRRLGKGAAQPAVIGQPPRSYVPDVPELPEVA